MKPQQFKQPKDAAIEAAELLVEAYRRGKSEGGHVDWSDVDLAHEWARRAVFEARQRRRKQRRRPAAAAAHEEGRALTAALSTVLDYLWKDEATAYAAASDAEKRGHIFESLCVIATSLAESGQPLADYLVQIPSVPDRNSQSAAHAEMIAHARYLAAIANPDYGDYDLNEALTRACALAGFVLGFDRLAKRRSAQSEHPTESDARLGRIRELVRALLSDDDHSEPFDVSMENACELASLVQALDRHCSAGELPRPWRERR